jgi:glycosyltransferase EpsH
VYKSKVSIIIPVYNAEKFLNECLSSLENQSLSSIEVIIVNDGSSDSSLTICSKFVNRDSRFILINQDNGGSAAARRTGMLAANGEYIGFMDADDWAESNMFETLYNTAKENDCDIVFCNCYRDDGERRIQCAKYIRSGLYNREEIVQEILPRSLAGLDSKGRNHVIRWANFLRIYRHDMVKKYEIYNDPRFRRCQDLQLTFEATLHAQSYYYLGDQYLYHNRVVNESQSRGYTKDQWNKIRILIERLYQDVEEFKEMDLHNQMDLCTFFFAVYSITNEGKHVEGMSTADHKRKLKEICDDPLIDICLETIPYSRLSAVNQHFYMALKAKCVDQLIKAIEYDKKEQRKHQLKEWFLSNKCIKRVYMILKR